LGPVWAGGASGDFAVFYLRYGGSYNASGQLECSPWKLLLFGTPSFTAFFVPVVTAAVAAAAITTQRIWNSDRTGGIPRPILESLGECAAVAAYALVAGYLTTITRTGFAHYLMLLVGPLTLVLASALAIWAAVDSGAARPPADHSAATGRLRLALLVAVLAVQLVSFAFEAAQKSRLLATWGTGPDPIAAEVRALARPGDRLHVWFAAPRFYAATSLPPATRISTSGRSSGGRAESMETRLCWLRLMEDLHRDPPEIFLDATAALAGFQTPTGPFVPTRADYHFGMPAMEEFVRTSYTLRAELTFAADGPPFLVYLRNDCLGRPPATDSAVGR
jgi:hypothetical protein